MKVLIVVLVALSQLVTSHEIKFTALRFGNNTDSFILTQPDLTPLRDALSICAWIKRSGDHNNVRQFWLSYVTSANLPEILISDTARSYFLQDITTYTRPNRTIGRWNHICTTWGYTTRIKYVYYDGQQIGSERTTTERKLGVPGSLMLGQLHYYYGGGGIRSNYYFGGELYDMNIFSTQLSADQVKEMYSQGRCSNYSQTFGQETFLRWKDVLLLERHGNVTDVEMSECDHTHPTEETTTDGVEKKWQFLRGTNFYNKVVSEELISDIRARLELLEEFWNHSIDDPLVAHLEKHHPNPVNDTSELEEEAS